MTPKEAYKLSYRNKELLIDDISCYFCFRYHKASEIKEWCDKGLTALCPFCSVDSVLPDKIDLDTLTNIHNYWFKKE